MRDGFTNLLREVLGTSPRTAHCERNAWFRTSVIKRKNKTPEYIGGFKQTRRTETSQYPEERTSTETPLVVASERGPGQWRMRDNRNRLESRALAGDSPVRVMQTFVLE